MGDANPPLQAAAARYQASSLVVPPRPDEFGYALRQDEFETLCEGGVGDAKNGRSLCFGCLVGAVVGGIGVLATADWESIWKPGRRGWFLGSVIALFLIIGASAAGMVIYHRRTAHDKSRFARLKSQIEQFYVAQAGPVDEDQQDQAR